MSRILCVAVVMTALSGPAMAGMSEGVAAVTVGDYEKAIAEFQPLAASGDPAAQYQLARIYLEGRGPANGVPLGVDLMTKAANGGHPEAQAQLGLMYAMGLGVDPDNVQAYQWLSKAVNALPAGTRRTVAEANRDAVVKRMSAAEQTKVAASEPKAAEKPAATNAAATASTTAATPAAKPAATQEAAKKPAATQEAAKKPAAEAAAKATTAPATTAAKTTTAPTTAATKTVTEAAATNKTATSAAKAPETKAKEAATTSKQAITTSADSKAPEKSTQVASAKAPEAGGETRKAMPSGVRIQLISMPSEDAAWAAWKQLSGKYASQLSGLTAIVEPADLGDKGTFYRVQTGPFTTVAAAQERCGAMKEAGLDCLVVGRP